MSQDLDYSIISRIVLRARRPDYCPHCGNLHVARIAYGFLAEPEPGESESDIVPGGCVITLDSPQWRCKGCSRGIFDDGLSDAVAREMRIQTQIKELERDANSKEQERLFRTFAEAREFAISDARNSGNSVLIERRTNGWYVPKVEQEKRNTDDSEVDFFDRDASWSEDLGDDDLSIFDSEIDEVYAEIGDYGTCLARSEEEGWFYDDENEDEAMRKELQRKDDAERRQDISC